MICICVSKLDQNTIKKRTEGMAKTVEAMGNEILAACSGQPTADAHEAMVMAMATHIGGLWFMSGKTLREAQEAVIEMAEDVAKHVAENWGEIEALQQH